MTKLKIALSAFAAVAAFACTQSHAQGNPTGLPNALNVKVTNTPLPVAGTVTGTVTVNNSASSPVPVTIANVPSAPIVVSAPKPALFRANSDIAWTGDSRGTGDQIENTSGKRIALQSVTVFGQVRAGETFQFARIETGNNLLSPQTIYIKPDFLGVDASGDPFNGWAKTEQVTAYVEPGERISLSAFRVGNALSGGSSVHFTLTGVLVA
jgi:hypothetical protein